MTEYVLFFGVFALCSAAAFVLGALWGHHKGYWRGISDGASHK